MNELDRIKANAAKMTTEALKEEFAQGLRVTRVRLLQLGAILVELDKREANVEGDKHLLKMLRRIGKGELLVDTVVRFAGRPYTLASIGRLPIEEQTRLMGEEDQAVDALLRPKRRPQRRTKASPFINTRERVEAPCRRNNEVNPLAAAAIATPKDLARLVADMILANGDPEAVIEELWRQGKLRQYLVEAVA